MSADSPVIEAIGLSAGYGNMAVVHEIDVAVRPGEIVVLLGPNGAGKSTTVLTLSGELKPLGGSVTWRGDHRAVPLYRRARTGLGLVTEERSVFMQMTTRDNLLVGGGDAKYALELFPELKERLRVKAGNLSGGEQQMLSLARALARRPKVLLADELSLGLAPLVVNRLLSAVRAAAESGVGVLLVEQHVRKALEIADRVYVMRRGRIESSGTASEVQARLGEIEASYLSVVSN
jgi:ABC-type branched-subunit amino acid transport system ATPase component